MTPFNEFSTKRDHSKQIFHVGGMLQKNPEEFKIFHKAINIF
jgi:hypothetical protein